MAAALSEINARQFSLPDSALSHQTSKDGTMPDKGKTTATTADATASATDVFAAFQKAGFGPMPWMGTAMVESLGDLSSEVLQFVADRIAQDVKTQHEILHCKDVTQLQKIQADFIQKAIEQYTAETVKLAQMSNDMIASTLTKKPG